MKNINILFENTIEKLKELEIRHEYMKFPSEAILLDVWHNNKFYVFQFEDSFIGVSEVNKENVGFDNIPDEKFCCIDDYEKKLKEIFDCRQ